MKPQEKNIAVSKKRLPGRPKKGITLNRMLAIRLTPAERILTEGKAKEAGMKLSEWFRKAAKSALVVPRFTPEETGWFRDLSGLANNFNQVNKLAHTTGFVSMASACRDLITKIDELLTNIRRDDREANNG